MRDSCTEDYVLHTSDDQRGRLIAVDVLAEVREVRARLDALDR
jgi:hypothetical protein